MKYYSQYQVNILLSNPTQRNLYDDHFDFRDLSKRGNLRNTILNIKITLLNDESDAQSIYHANISFFSVQYLKPKRMKTWIA